MQERITALVEQMTLEEKVSMVAGADFWTTVPVERLNIPSFKVTDGPNGARGAGSSGHVPSACFPVGVAMGATWNVDLIERVGKSLGDEVIAKGAQLLLAPTVNIHRSPLAGRNFECYSEDPYLTARAAVAYINGVQSKGVGACIKHFIANDSEFERHTISSEVTERALREIYLYPFMVAVPEAKPWSVMSSYNRINGIYAAENAYTLIDILKKEWQYEGFVISDWFGTQSTVASANNGLDLEMPGPAKWFGDKLLQAVKDGQVSEEAIDDKIRRLLRILIISGLMDNPGLPEEGAADSPEQRALIREAAGESMVLLKNVGNVLPITEDNVKKLAIIGPNAKAAVIMGGGSSQVSPYYVVTPFEGMMNRVPDSMQVEYAQGCTSHKQLPVIEAEFLTPAKGGAENGLTVEYFDSLDLSGDVVHTEVHGRSDMMWVDHLPEGINIEGFSVRMSGTFTPKTTGEYTLGIASNGLNRLVINGKTVFDNWQNVEDDDAFNEKTKPTSEIIMELTAGEGYEMVIEYAKHQKMTWTGVRVGCVLNLPKDAIEQAAKLAAECDTAVIFAGLNGEWESEGFDRPGMKLTPGQDKLIKAVAKANPKTVVVLNVGSPVNMPWIEDVAAVLIAWFPGQEAGNAMADVLFGDRTPSGKLPTTFPKRLEDNPAFVNYPGENGQVFYGEGIFVGYRYYEKKKIKPLFPFGHGLSYTAFSYSDLTLDAKEYGPEDEIKVSVAVTNTGDVAGQEVVQLYVKEKKPVVARPKKELRGYKKVMLQPGETQTVEMTLNWQSLAYYDTGRKGWAAQAGKYKVLVGSSSADIRAKAKFNLTQSVFAGESDGAGGLNTYSTLRQLFANDAVKAYLQENMGAVVNNPQIEMAMDFTLRQVADFAPDQLTNEVLDNLDVELGKL